MLFAPLASSGVHLLAFFRKAPRFLQHGGNPLDVGRDHFSPGASHRREQQRRITADDAREINDAEPTRPTKPTLAERRGHVPIRFLDRQLDRVPLRLPERVGGPTSDAKDHTVSGCVLSGETA